MAYNSIPITHNLPDSKSTTYLNPNVDLFHSKKIFFSQQEFSSAATGKITPIILVKNLSHQPITLLPGTLLGDITFKRNLDYHPSRNVQNANLQINSVSIDTSDHSTLNPNTTPVVPKRKDSSSDLCNPQEDTATSLHSSKPTYAASLSGENSSTSSNNALKMANRRNQLVSVNQHCSPFAPRIAGTPMSISRQIITPKAQSHLRAFYTNLFDQNHKQNLINSIISDTPDLPDPSHTNTDCDITDIHGTPIKISNNLDPAMQDILKSLFSKHKDVFASSAIDLKKAKILPAVIKLSDDEPVHSPPFNLSSLERSHLNDVISDFLKIGVIEESQSPYASPAFLVKKPHLQKDVSELTPSDKRLVVDYRKLNKKVIPDRYPLPRIDNILSELRGHRYYSQIDFLQGFYQQELTLKSRPCTALTTPQGLFQFTRQPMGIRNGTSSFSRAINRVFADLLYHGVVIYVDNLYIYSDTLEEHLRLLNIVFERLSHHLLRIKTEKCSFFDTSIDLLGFHISETTFSPSKSNLSAILRSPPPTSYKQLRSFLGSCTFYRNFVFHFSKTCAPLYEILKQESKNSPFIWTPAAQEAFTSLQTKFITPPVLHNFDESKETTLIVDSSNIATGAILAQKGTDNKLHPIGYFSKILPPLKSWSATQLELRGLVHATQHFREFLYGRKFTVISDHKSLEYFQNFKNASSRLNKLVSQLLDYDFNIVYTKNTSPSIKAADYLSRYPQVNSISLDNSTNIFQSQQNDPQIKAIYDALLHPQSVTDQKLLRLSRRFVLKDNLVYLQTFSKFRKSLALYIPETLRPEVLNSCHNSLIDGAGHFSFKKSYDHARFLYYWPTLSTDLQSHIKSCISCAYIKKAPKYGLLEPIKPPLNGKPFSHIIIDFLGPLPCSNKYTYVLMAICTLTKYAITAATLHADSPTVADFLVKKVIPNYGFFNKISSDRGSHFENDLIANVCKSLNINQQFSTAYHPQSQGLVERNNAIIISVLKHYINDNKNNWSNLLPFITFAYNSTVHSATNHSPFYLTHGYHPDTSLSASLPTDDSNLLDSITNLIKVRQSLPAIIEKAQNKYKETYDKGRKPIHFEPNDKVLVTLTPKHSKLDPLYKGPFKVIKKLSDVNYVIEMPMRNKISQEIIHVSRLKPHPKPTLPPLASFQRKHSF